MSTRLPNGHTDVSRAAAASSRLGWAPWLLMALLLALALLGSWNQTRFRYQSGLLDQKEQLQSTIASLRLSASGVAGPGVIGAWARANGMVPVPQVNLVREVAPQPLPLRSEPLQTGLEVSTVWR